MNLLLDGALLLSFTALCWSGVVVRFVFPAPSAGQGWTLWGRGLDGWVALQFNLLAALALLVLLHVMLHWNWVCAVTADWLRRTKGRRARADEALRTIYGAGLLIAIVNVLGLLTAAAVLSIRGPQS
jgi:hypothetical protein